MLECEPEGPAVWSPSADQRWPTDVARTASTLGLEPYLNSAGVPIVGPEILATPGTLADDTTWHYLSLAFAEAGVALQVEAWAACRATLVDSLAPSTWPGPPGCDTILVVTEADYLLLLTRDTGLVRIWIAERLQAAFTLTSSDALAVATWLIDALPDVGVCLRSIQAMAGQVQVRGRWGRGAGLMLRAGLPEGATFSLDLPRSGSGAV